MAKLAENSAKVLEFLQQNDAGEGVSVHEIAEALGKTTRSVIPTITLSLGTAPKDGSRGILATYEKREVEGEDKPVGFAVLTEEGLNFDLSADAE